jgi:hypothetical protein
MSAALVQVAPPALLVSVPLASAALLFALQAAWPVLGSTILHMQITGIAMGILVRRGAPPLVAIVGAATPLLLPGLARFLLQGGAGLIRPDATLIDQMVTEAIGHYRLLNIPEERLAESGELLREVAAVVLSVAPALRFIGLLAVFFMIYLVCQSMFARFGFAIRPIGRFPMWRLSHWYVWVFAVGLLGLLLPGETQRVAGRNLIVVMVAAYFIQGLSVTQFLMVRRRIGFALRFLIYSTAIVAIFPFFAAMTTGIGLFDTWFDFRGLEPREPAPEDEAARQDDDD